MDADPTMELIRSLDDPKKWVRQTVIAFVPHEITHGAKGQIDGSTVPAQTIKVTEGQLRQDAERANERARKTGRLDTLTIGHRKFDPNFPETQQPPLVGFCRNYRVQWIEREEGRFLGLVYDEYAALDKAAQYDLYRQFPFRSSEYHPSVGIAGVAALVRPPMLDMGTTYIYQAAGSKEPTVDENQFATLFAKCMQTYEASKTAAAEEAKKKADEEAKKTATYQNPNQPPAVPPVVPAPVAATPAEIATYAATVADLRKRLDDETAARVSAECRAMLDPLKPLIKFNYDRELALLIGAPDSKARATHVAYMAETYMPLPGVGGMVRVYEGVPTPAADASDPTRDQPHRKEIKTYMTAHPGMSYESAEAHVLAKYSK